MNSARTIVAVVFTGLISGPAARQQTVAEIAPVAPTIVKVYEKGPDGLELFRINAVVIEPASGALWIQYGGESEPPIRIDRTTGAVKLVGRKGAGPNEYRRVFAMVPGAQGDVGIWDPSRRLWFWVDSAGVQRRTWSIPTNSLLYGRVFSDIRGNVYIGQNARLGEFGNEMAVRLDSARGLVDSLPVPAAASNRYRWSYTAVSAGGGRGSAGMVVRYAPIVHWGVDARGRVFAAWSDSNFIAVIDSGRQHRLFVPDYREPLTATERAQADSSISLFEANARSRGAQLDGPRPPVPGFRPQIAGVVPEMNGGIAITRTRPCNSVPGWRGPGNAPPVDHPLGRCGIVERFDADGRRLRPFTLGAGQQLAVLRSDTAWVTISTADGLSRVIEMVIPRR
jgi:hypothetical protein